MAAYATPATPLQSRIATTFETMVAITPTDANAIGPFQALYVGGAGDVVVVPRNSTSPVTFKAVPVGTILPISIQGVNATGTTATNLVGLG